MTSTVNRINSIQCIFDRKAPRPNSFDFQDWILDDVKIPADVIDTFQLDFVLYSVFVKFISADSFMTYVQSKTGEHQFKHSDGTISKVQIVPSGIRNVRVFNVPPECPNALIEKALTPYGDVLSTVNETWGPAHRLQCNSGVRSVRMDVKRPIPSYMTIEGTRAQISYFGQLPTCSICQSTDHLRMYCPRKRPAQLPRDSNVVDEQMFPLLTDVIRRTPTVTDKVSTSGTATPGDATAVVPTTETEGTPSQQTLALGTPVASVSTPVIDPPAVSTPVDTENLDDGTGKEASFQKPTLPPFTETEGSSETKQKSRNRRSRKKKDTSKASDEQIEGDGAQATTLSSGSDTESGVSTVSMASASDERHDFIREHGRQLEALLASAKDRGIQLKRKTDQPGEHQSQRLKSLSGVPTPVEGASGEKTKTPARDVEKDNMEWKGQGTDEDFY